MKPNPPPIASRPGFPMSSSSSNGSGGNSTTRPIPRPISVQRKILPLGDPPPQNIIPPSNSASPGGRQVLRVNRACNACRKQKMRCEGPDSPPCTRCKASGQQCVFEKVQKQDSPDSSSQRLSELESKWTNIESTLGDVLKELRDVKSSLNQARPGSAGGIPQYLSSASPAASSPQDYRSTTYSPRVGTSSPSLAHNTPVQGVGGTSGSFRHHSHSFSSIQSHSQLPHIEQSYGSARLGSPRQNPSSAPIPSDAPSGSASYASGNPLRASSHNGGHMPPPSLTSRRRNTHPTSNLYSANNSGDEEDLPSAALAAPISVVNDIASAHPVDNSDSDEDNSSESEDEVVHGGDAQSSGSPRLHQRHMREKRKRRDSSVADRSRARFRTDGDYARMDLDSTAMMTLDKRPGQFPDASSMSSVASNSSALRGKRRRRRDVIEKGLITEEEGMQLYNNYFSGCHRLLAVFDRRVDTFASIRERSPFLLSALLMVGAKVRDGPIVSDLQASLLHEATEQAKDRVFESKGRVEDVQALLLLAGWSHSMGGVGWLTAGHAIRVAVELGIPKALPKLEKLLGVDETDPESHRPLITAARTWLALYVFEYQISFGTGRPAMMRGDTAITKAKDILLGHPLSIATDARLVSTCELLTRQNAIHQRLEACLELRDDSAVYRTLMEATDDIDQWLDEWDARMSASQPTAGFFRSSAAIQRAYANLFHNCIALRGLKTAADTKFLSPDMKAIALQAIQSAKECITICLNNPEYREGLKYAVAYTHTCAAFAGGFLLRFVRLFPAEVDLAETTQLVEALANILSEVPAVSFAVWLRKMLSHTRQKMMQSAHPSSSHGSDMSTGSNHESEAYQQALQAVHSHTLSGPDMLPPPLPPIPNSQPFIPVGASSNQYHNEFSQIVHPTLTPTMTGRGGGADTSAWGDSTAAGMLHGLLGDGQDWPPWLTTSMVGDLDQHNVGSAQSELTFAWNPPPM